MKSLKLLVLLISICFVDNTIAQTVYTTKTGEKYHKSNCRYLKYSKKERKLKDVISLGYEACLVCKPSRENSISNSNSISSSKSSRKIYSTPVKKTSSTSSQCTGRTKSGNRCKRKTKSSNGRCYQH